MVRDRWRLTIQHEDLNNLKIVIPVKMCLAKITKFVS